MKVSVQRFYRMSLALPLLVPGIAISGALLFGAPIFPPLMTLLTFIAISGWFGALPYTVLAVWWFKWLPGKTEAEIQRMARRAPLAMLVAFVPMALILGSIDGDMLEGAFLLAIAIPFILLFGYAYVGITFYLREIGGRRGCIVEA